MNKIERIIKSIEIQLNQIRRNNESMNKVGLELGKDFVYGVLLTGNEAKTLINEIKKMKKIS